MSHGTQIIITFTPCGERTAVAKLALEHLERVKAIPRRAGEFNNHGLFVVEQYLDAVGNNRIYVPESKYVAEPITYSTINHQMGMEDVLELLSPFFKELFVRTDDDGESLLNHADAVCVFHKYENDHAMQTWSITTNWEAHRGVLTGLNIDAIQFDIERNDVPVELN